MRILALAIVSMGCSSSPDEGPATETLPTDARNWVQTLVDTPSQFGATIEGDRAGWIALHRGDWTEALASNDSAVLYQAHGKLSAFYQQLDRISTKTWQHNQKIWRERSDLEVANELRSAARLADYNSPLADIVSAGTEPLPAPLQAMADSTLNLDRTGLLERAREAAFLVPGKNIRVQDPLVFQGLHARHVEALQDTPVPTGLDSVLFTACAEAINTPLTPTQAHPYACAENSLLAQAKLDTERLRSNDDAQLARELARELDNHLESWSTQLGNSPNTEGRELLSELQLVDIYRSQTLLALAEQSLLRDHPRQALSLAQLAQDMRTPRDIGPINTPLLFAILAEANLSTGRFREALEPLEILSRAFPEVAGLDEAVGDLSILSNINRQGDSKEL